MLLAFSRDTRVRTVCNVLSATAPTTANEEQTSIIAGAGPTTAPGNRLSSSSIRPMLVCGTFDRVTILVSPMSFNLWHQNNGPL